MKRLLVFTLCCLLATPAYAVEYLKQSTAATLKIGPFVDETDGKTAETGLTLSQADFRLSKNAGDFAQKNESTSGTHDELGYYDVPVNATDTNTLGRLLVAVHESGALPVWKEYMVLPANTYDSLVSGSDALNADVDEWNSSAVASPATAGYPAVTIKDGTGTGEIDTTSGAIASASLSTTSTQNITGYRTVTNLLTSDNAETVIEAATAGTLVNLAPGAHSQTGPIAVPDGVNIRGAGKLATVLTGTLSNGAHGVLTVNGSNEISDLTIIAASDGNCISTTSAGAAYKLTIRRCRLVGVDDVIGLLAPASGFGTCLIEDCDLTFDSFDAIAIFTGKHNVTIRNCRFFQSGVGQGSGHKAVYLVSASGTEINVTLDGCVSVMDTPLANPDGFVSAASSGGSVKVTAINCTHNGASSFWTGNHSSIVFTEANNVYTSANALSGGATVTNAAAAAANTAVVAGTVGTNAATAATQSTAAASSASTAATQSTNAASSAATAVTQTTAAAQRAALGFASANADTQLAAIASSATTAATQATSAASNSAAAAIRSALGMASANFDTTLSAKASQSSVDALPAAVVATTPPEEFFENAPSGGGGDITREDADMIAARVNAHRGEFYPNAKYVMVLKRGDSGLEVKNAFKPSKGANETLKLYIDFASVVGRNEFIETINSLSLSGGTATIVADSEEIVGNLLSFQVTGGAAEDVTAVEFDVTSTEDQQFTSDVCEFTVVE